MLFRSGVIRPHVFNTLRRVEQELLSRPSTSDLWNQDGPNVHARSHLRYVSRLRSFCLYNLRSHCAGPIQALRVSKRPSYGGYVRFQYSYPWPLSTPDPLIWAEGESHRKQRRSTAASFDSTAIRKSNPAIHKTVDKLGKHAITQAEAGVLSLIFRYVKADEDSSQRIIREEVLAQRTRYRRINEGGESAYAKGIGTGSKPRVGGMLHSLNIVEFPTKSCVKEVIDLMACEVELRR
ncbi:hypothetical protein M404DRAFT_20677 [Pisolithus tinctorius Marx 270]|uniref:Uncharacterized protein n=1 Tax=Pisolithus tinctorius Marx 270 TaxID=870435 RepID=A0A0C3KNK0_PISTI|nr:hypothetical protein M404DRAFT_20677 [Pisolithus tinctorius Marx 270]